jgi:flagellar hook protein FlgE
VGVDTGATSSDFHSLDDLIAEINNDFVGSFSATLDANGSIVMEDLSGSAHQLIFTADNPTLQTAFSAANGMVDSSSGTTTQTDEFSHTATSSEELSKLRNSLGISLDLNTGDTIDVGGKVGASYVQDPFTVLATSTLGDLVNKITSVFSITNTNGVQIDSDGSLKIYGEPGEDFAITNVAIRENNGNDPFNTVMTFNEIQKATDIVHNTSITVYDALGESHLLTMAFKKTSIRNQWEWEATTGGNEIIAAGNKGTITFNSDGSMNTFTYDNGVSAFEFDPATGADTMRVRFDMGEPGDLGGVTQFSSISTTVANAQDGYTNGDLVNITIDKVGKITGIFSNGVNQTLAQIILAKFNNPNGLYREGNNMYSTSANSGLPISVTAGESIQSEIIPGTLEMSNVNLAQEFSDMILAQRGFQANARVITTSDDLLNELVNIKR